MKGFLLIVVVILGTSCREAYFPNDMEHSDPILSVHGIIYENEQPVIKLSWSLGYYEENEKPVSNAIVIITDDDERTDTLSEVEQTGIYSTSFNEPYEAGRIYTLHIETENGNIYTSNPVKMPVRPVVEGFYATKSSREIFEYTADGKIMKFNIPGAMVFTDLSGEGDESIYYRFRTRVVERRKYTKPPVTEYVYYQFEKTNDLYDIAKSSSDGNLQIVRQHEDIFLEEQNNPIYDLDYQGFSVLMSYIIIHRIYSISADVYDFYSSIKEQLTAENEIFAPVPSKIKSNIFCINNQDASVIGVFEASSTLTLYMSCKVSYSYLSATPLDAPPLDLPVFEIPEYPALTQ